MEVKAQVIENKLEILKLKRQVTAESDRRKEIMKEQVRLAIIVEEMKLENKERETEKLKMKIEIEKLKQQLKERDETVENCQTLLEDTLKNEELKMQRKGEWLECPVCLETYTAETRVFVCLNGHWICGDCKNVLINQVRITLKAYLLFIHNVLEMSHLSVCFCWQSS